LLPTATGRRPPYDRVAVSTCFARARSAPTVQFSRPRIENGSYEKLTHGIQMSNCVDFVIRESGKGFSNSSSGEFGQVQSECG